jgi:hypothetical protein
MLKCKIYNLAVLNRTTMVLWCLGYWAPSRLQPSDLSLFTFRVVVCTQTFKSNFMFECRCILDEQIKVRPTRCNQWWFIGNQLFLNMFRVSLRPSSGEQTASHCLWCFVLAVSVVVPDSLVAGCVHCEKDVARLKSSNILWLLAVKQHPFHSAHIPLPDCPEPQQLSQDRTP